MALTSKQKALTAFSTVALLLTGCESSADIERKPAVAAAMLDQSLARCGLQGDTAQNYRQRLAEVFADSRTSHLETLQREGVAVCLDRRLKSQRSDLFTAEAVGTYYAGERIMTVIDSGRGKQDERFMEVDAIDRGSLIIKRLSDKLEDNETTSIMIARRVGCGKNCTTTRLYNARGYDTYQYNPQLQNAPVNMRNSW